MLIVQHGSVAMTSNGIRCELKLRPIIDEVLYKVYFTSREPS